MPMRATFQEELDSLESMLQQEAQLVLRSLRGAQNVLRERDTELADEIIAFDDEVDASYLTLEQGIASLLARQTPVAVDLRLVLAILHINLHLERMADLCVTTAKLVKLAEGLKGDQEILESFEEMGARAEEMTIVAMRALAERDLAGAESLVDLDELVDRINRRFVRHVLEVSHDEEKREFGLRMLLISRCLERLADHAVDIGEQVAYLITGELREFSDASHVAVDGV